MDADRQQLRDRLSAVRSAPDASGELAALAADIAAVQSKVEFFDVDIELVRLIEDALEASTELEDTSRALLVSRLAMELVGDPAGDERRAELVAEAVSLARGAGDARTLIDVLLNVEHADWGLGRAERRIAVAGEVIDSARSLGDVDAELTARLWRFVGLLELGRLADAEVERAAYSRLASAASRQEAIVIARAREATIATARGEFDVALDLAADVRRLAAAAAMPDADRLFHALRTTILIERDPSQLDDAITMLGALSRRMPGMLFEAKRGYVFARMGRFDEAHLDLQRCMPALARAARVRPWALCDAAFIAARTADRAAAKAIHGLLSPFGGLYVPEAGGVAFCGAIDHFLAMLETTLGEHDAAIAHLEHVVGAYAAMSALPLRAHATVELARALRARGGAMDARRADELTDAARALARALDMNTLLREIEDAASTGASAAEWLLIREQKIWTLSAGTEIAQVADLRGVRQLARLLANPGRDIAAAELLGLDASSDALPLVDHDALRAYRRRLHELDEALAEADATGDAAQSAGLTHEREAILGELKRATGLGGRLRATGPAERARINATRTIRQAIEQISQVAPLAGAHLAASIRTGTRCRYEPAPGGPDRWRVTGD
jgi:hypothetical protein